MHDRSGELRFHLEGRLSGAWVGELRQCWLTAQSTIGVRKTSVDLRDVDYVDGDGCALLQEMRRQGATLMAVTPLICEMVQEIERSQGCARVEEAPAQRSDAFVPSDPTARRKRAL